VREVADEAGILEISKYFDLKFGYAECSGQICAISADRRAQTKHLKVGQELFHLSNNDEFF
jgi:hypothetical protein